MKNYQLSFLVLLSAILLSSTSFAQKDYVFKVLVNKGQNQVKAGADWQALKTGATLRSGDELKVAGNSYIGLIHNSGKPLEVKVAGSYKVDDLAQNMAKGATVLNRYTDFVLSSNTEKQNRLAATGAVHRGLHTVKVFLPKSESSIIYGDKVSLNWSREPGDVTYIVALKTVFGEELRTTETKDTTLLVNLKDAKFINEDNIIIEVYPKGEPSKIPDPPYMIKKLSPADKERIKVQLNEISSITTEETALNKLILAGFFEQNKLFIDAANAYQEAIMLAPDVQQIREDYDSFLLRNGIKEAKK